MLHLPLLFSVLISSFEQSQDTFLHLPSLLLHHGLLRSSLGRETSLNTKLQRGGTWRGGRGSPLSRLGYKLCLSHGWVARQGRSTWHSGRSTSACSPGSLSRCCCWSGRGRGAPAWRPEHRRSPPPPAGCQKDPRLRVAHSQTAPSRSLLNSTGCWNY